MKSFASFIALIATAAVSSGAVNFTVVGEYDAAGSNTVDASATSLTVATFSGMIQTAFANGTGGVINFENRGGDLTNSTWGVSYNGGASNLNFTLPYSSVAFDAASISATAISGSNYFRLTGHSSARQSNTFTFAEGSYLSSFGLTFLARNAAIGDIYITGTYHDNSTFTLFDSASPFSNPIITGSGNTATTDTFVGFTADSGKAIKTLTINLPSGTYPVIDDFGFIVSPIPEPSSAMLGLLGAAGFLVRRRRA